VRIKEVYAKLNNMAQRAGALLVDQEEATTEKSLNKIAKALTELDAEMKDMVDYIFDSKVSDVLAQGTNMYSPVNGEFWFEHCIDVLIGLYNANFSKEMRKMKEQVQKQTSKYSYMR
jgi:phage-related protein